jgi:hypothetical protein
VTERVGRRGIGRGQGCRRMGRRRVECEVKIEEREKSEGNKRRREGERAGK